MRKIILADRKERQNLQQCLPLGGCKATETFNQEHGNNENRTSKPAVDPNEYILDDIIEGATDVTGVYWPLKSESNNVKLNIQENVLQVRGRFA